MGMPRKGAQAGPTIVDAGGGPTRRRENVGATDSTHGVYALSPLKTMVLLGVSGLVFVAASVFQISGTEQAVFSNLLSNVSVTPTLILWQFQHALSGKLDFENGVAFAVGAGIQFVLLTVTFPASGAYAILHGRYGAQSGETHEGAVRIKSLQDLGTKIIIGCDLITDVLYISQHVAGHQIFSMVLWVLPWPNLDGSNAGILVIAVLYACLLCFVNVVSLKFCMAFAEVLLLKVRGLA